MPLHLAWSDVAVRLLLTLLAGAVIGFDRGERGHAAGLRTTMLLCLAASVSMIQVNLLLSLSGKTPESFATLDIMRLPLGILSGMGFIGAGAILRKGDKISGVTTAATLWVVTVIGLCIGGGQVVLGIAATVVVWLILYAVRSLEVRVPRRRKSTMVITVRAMVDADAQLEALLKGMGLAASYCSGKYDRATETAELNFEVRWQAAQEADKPAGVVERIMAHPSVQSIQWNITS